MLKVVRGRSLIRYLQNELSVGSLCLCGPLVFISKEGRLSNTPVGVLDCLPSQGAGPPFPPPVYGRG